MPMRSPRVREATGSASEALPSHLCSTAVPENHLVTPHTPPQALATSHRRRCPSPTRTRALKVTARGYHVHPSLRRGCSSGLMHLHQVPLVSSTLGCQRQQGDLSQPEPRIISALRLTCSSPSPSASPTGPRKTWAPHCPPGC